MSDYQIFDRSLLRQRQQRAVSNNAQHDFLHRLAAERLCDRVEDVKRDFSIALQWGNVLNASVVEKKKINYLVNSLSNESQISFSLEGEGGRRPDEEAISLAMQLPIIADEEFFPFGSDTFDLILCNLNLQFVNDLPGALLQMKQSLKPNGLFLAALAGGQSLIELREILMAAEMELAGGVSPRVAPMVDLRDAAGLLQRAGFGLPVADSEIVEVSYRHIFHLMQDLRGMGWTNIIRERHKKFTSRALFMRAAELYKEKYPDADGIKASFELIYLSGWRDEAKNTNKAATA